MLDARCWMLDAGGWSLNVGIQYPVTSDQHPVFIIAIEA
jgi:hypothetical protein